MQTFNKETQMELSKIADMDLPEMEKLIRLFDWTTRRIVEYAQQEIELARAMHDEEQIVKQKIKMATVKLVRGVFQDSYLRASGKRTRLWEE